MGTDSFPVMPNSLAVIDAVPKMPRVYLAGPEVFRPDAMQIAQKKKEICAEFGLEGCFPMDTELKGCSNLEPKEISFKISTANENMMLSCDAVIANMTPFRSPSMDVGTAFEMGFMRALGRPVLGYTNNTESFVQRTKRWCEDQGQAAVLRSSGHGLE